MAWTTYTNNKIVDAISGKTTFTALSNAYFALSTTTPTVSGTNFTEPSENAYARVAVPGSYWSAASGGSTANTTAIEWPTATGSWGTITYVGIFDASSGGNLLAYFLLPASQAIPSGVAPKLNIGDATLSNT